MKTSEQIILNECQSAKRKIDQIQAQKMYLYERYVLKELQKSDYIRQKNDLSTEEERLKAQYIMLEQKKALLEENRKMSMVQMTVGEKITPYQELTELTPGLTKELIKRIVIKPNGNIRIEWNFSDEIADLIEMTQILSKKQAI